MADYVEKKMTIKIGAERRRGDLFAYLNLRRLIKLRSLEPILTEIEKNVSSWRLTMSLLNALNSKSNKNLLIPSFRSLVCSGKK